MLLIISGFLEFLLGNTFPSVVFFSYGAHCKLQSCSIRVTRVRLTKYNSHYFRCDISTIL